ncbi:MAG: acyl-CoA dehydrogenase family protein [Pseudomonadota bacterium]
MNEANINALIAEVRERADEIDEGGTLPADLATRLKSAGLFSLLLPASLGGPQIHFPDFVQLVQSFAEADASTAWCINQGSVLATLAARMPVGVARQIWHAPEVAIANGPPMDCVLRTETDPPQLTGQWIFSSGINHADYLAGVARRDDGVSCWCFFPTEQAEINSHWPVNGLRGTASYSFAVKQLPVQQGLVLPMSEPPTGAPLYHIPMNLMFACGFAAVSLGVARAAITFTIERVKSKIKRFQNHPMAEDQVIQAEIGKAEADYLAAHALLHGAVADIWREIETPLDLDERMKLRLAATHALRMGKTCTDRMYDLCSTDSIFKGNDIQRRFQDAHVISQHLQGRPENYQLAGRYLLDLPIDRTMIS